MTPPADDAAASGEWTFSVSVRALCAFAAKAGDLDLRFVPAPSALEGQAGHRRVQGRRGPDYRSEVPLQAVHRGLRVRGRADGFDEAAGRVEEIKTHRGPIERLKANQRALHRAQARVYGHLLCASRGLAGIEVACVYLDLESGEETPVAEPADAAALRAEFESMCERYLDWARQEHAHRRARDAWLGALRFPHGRFRAGQRELAEAAFRCARDGGALLAEAPTGIGKTLATLFPVLKAVAGQGLHKLFFLTAKTTGRALALDGLATLAPAGAPLRVLELTAREKACEQPGRACHGDDCPLAAGFYDRLPAARAEAVREARLDRPALRRLAASHAVCPYYLSQEMVRWADVVVGDCNYFFDASAFLFAMAREEEWRVPVLVDEAHNLLERARGMYSAELGRDALQAASQAAPRALRGTLGRLGREWTLLERDQGEPYVAHERVPERLARALQDAVQALAEHLNESSAAVALPLQRFFFDALHLARLVEGFGAHALFETERDDAAAADLTHTPPLRLRLRNLVPAPYLRPRFAAAHGVVAFSGTLQPMDFHVEHLGLPQGTRQLRVDSPFDASQLRIGIATDLSTRWRDRDRSLPVVVDLLAAQFRDQPGNYLAYFGSFDYLEAVHAALRARHPDLPLWPQRRGMDEAERAAFVARFEPQGRGIGLAVLGGAFGEGIDLPGDRLIGAFIAGLGLPRPDAANEAARERLQQWCGDGWNAVYLYPGLQKVVQAAGRVIRDEGDRGVLYLLDDRFNEPRVRALLPDWWQPQPMRLARPSRRLLARVLPRAADVGGGEHDLQRDERPGVGVEAPDRPEHVAREEDPETQEASALALGRDVPGRRDAEHHGGPLQQVQPVHPRAVSPASSSSPS